MSRTPISDALAEAIDKAELALCDITHEPSRQKAHEALVALYDARHLWLRFYAKVEETLAAA